MSGRLPVGISHGRFLSIPVDELLAIGVLLRLMTACAGVADVITLIELSSGKGAKRDVTDSCWVGKLCVYGLVEVCHHSNRGERAADEFVLATAMAAAIRMAGLP
mgnify:CR=1 FL=1